MNKKKWMVVGAIVAVVAIVAVCLGVAFFQSPEYALYRMAKDVEKTGPDGMMPYLTGDAKAMMEKVKPLLDDGTVEKTVNALTGQSMSLQQHMAAMKWELKAIERAGQEAAILVAFNYKDMVTGELEIGMTRASGDWKIYEMPPTNVDLSGLDFSKLDLSAIDLSALAELMK